MKVEYISSQEKCVPKIRHENILNLKMYVDF
jgi:hypothetical protein